MRPERNAERWLDQAREDLRWAEHLLEEGGYHVACFLAQQVAEKALKAVLYFLGEPAVTGHAVADLCRRVAERFPETAERCEAWAYLDTFYLATRCPDALPGGIPARAYGRPAADQAVGLAREVVDAARQRLSAPEPPA